MLSQGSPCEEVTGRVPGEEREIWLKQPAVDEMQISETSGTSDMKVAEKEVLGLLRWLASSQAADDINSDDELAHETILSPLLPAATIDKVLAKANLDYESESQQECQDILDSIEDSLNFKVLNGSASCSIAGNHPMSNFIREENNSTSGWLC
ncbi:hypothetical protein F0562_019982 [Nyssa sinensis]|uniref:Uncharacterized protein n=1 Tax=Nyssa sinensis TaxID=561372 RepID=A0A5J5BQG7_9ASTE|nr:hypothetical protein F0562_019982 [Nyssa sinensis]